MFHAPVHKPLKRTIPERLQSFATRNIAVAEPEKEKEPNESAAPPDATTTLAAVSSDDVWRRPMPVDKEAFRAQLDACIRKSLLEAGCETVHDLRVHHKK